MLSSELLVNTLSGTDLKKKQRRSWHQLEVGQSQETTSAHMSCSLYDALYLLQRRLQLLESLLAPEILVKDVLVKEGFLPFSSPLVDHCRGSCVIPLRHSDNLLKFVLHAMSERNEPSCFRIDDISDMDGGELFVDRSTRANLRSSQA